MTNQLAIKCPDLGEISATKCAATKARNVRCMGCTVWQRFAQEAQDLVEKDQFAGCQFKAASTSGRPKQPAMSIYPSGDIGLSARAEERFKGFPFVKLYFEPSTRTLAIKPLAAYEAGAIKIGQGGKGSKDGQRRRAINRIAGAAYIKEFGITERPKGVPLEWSPTHGMWCARLKG